MSRPYTNKRKSDRPPVGTISIEAIRLASVLCRHVDDDDPLPCTDCMREAQAAINESQYNAALRNESSG